MKRKVSKRAIAQNHPGRACGTVSARGARATTSGRKRRQRRYKVGCLFAAIGGFCKAFEEVGATVAWANEKDKFACDTFLANFPHIRYLRKPVEDLTVKGDDLEPVEVLTAGFPCKPLSLAREKCGFKVRTSVQRQVTTL
jgi:hypothetical protein